MGGTTNGQITRCPVAVNFGQDTRSATWIYFNFVKRLLAFDAIVQRTLLS